MRDSRIRSRERATIVQSLQAGVVPRVGLHHIQVGRVNEVKAVLGDLGMVGDGGACIRFIVGRFGSGKTFFLNLMRTLATEKKFVVVQADITNDRRLHATGGQARTLYSELMRNMTTKAKPQGGALPSVLQRWISEVQHEVQQAGGDDTEVEGEIYSRLSPLQELVSGFDFAAVLVKYLKGYQTGNEELQNAAIRWLRAEISTKTEARQCLDVRSIIDDADIYDYLKLLAQFVHLAGYAGLLVNIDEMGVLSHRLASTQARNSNYESILRILNDCLQGNVSRIGFMFAGTDTFLEDRRRGLFSYEALATRLAPNTFTQEGMVDYSNPVIELDNLKPEDLFVLLMNIRSVFASGDPGKYLVPDEALEAFMQYCQQKLGSSYFRTPRDTVKNFVGLLSILEQYPERKWQDLIGEVPASSASHQSQDAADHSSPSKGNNTSGDTEERDAELITFKLKR